MGFLIKNKKYFYSLLLIAVVFSFALLPPLMALAQTPPAAAPNTKEDSSFVGEVITWFAAKPILFAANLISVVLSSLFGVILSLEAMVIDYILNPNTFSFVNSQIVVLGWGITRDLANMFLILILLVIAFATVLKIQSYAITQLWKKVLIVALLINFSLVIAGIVIDFTQVLTNFFLHQITGGDIGTISMRLASSMRITNFYNPTTASSGMQGLTQLGASAIAALVGVILTLVGLVITVFVFGATAIFLIVRIIWIWFLLIVAPLACMFYILPATSGYFKQWWDKFISWTFFAPAYVFMIYLSLSIFDQNGNLKAGSFAANQTSSWNTAAAGLTTVSMPSAIFQWILVIAMMFGSLIVAKSFGVLPGKLIDAVTGATKGAAKAAGLSTIKTYGRVATGLGNLGASQPPGSFANRISAPIRGLATITGLKALGGYATGAKGGVYTAPLKSTPNNPLKAVMNGAVKGSGLWKNDIKDWQCSFHPSVQVKSKKKPTFACPQATTTPPLHPLTPADWIEV